MGYVCYFTGKKVGRGMKRVWRGQAISKGGFGLKPTGITPRLFKPNLQPVVAVITTPDGTRRVKRVRASAKAIRNGLVVKALKRKYGYTRQKKQAAAS
jgi:large subunit ribosomal protein L28